MLVLLHTAVTLVHSHVNVLMSTFVFIAIILLYILCVTYVPHSYPSSFIYFCNE